MATDSVTQMTAHVARLMEERLRIRGRGLAAKLRRGGRLLPRPVRNAVAVLVRAESMAQSHKLRLQIDLDEVAQAHDLCVRHLGGISLWRRRMDRLLGITASIAFSLLVLAGLMVALLRWRGFL